MGCPLLPFILTLQPAHETPSLCGSQGPSRWMRPLASKPFIAAWRHTQSECFLAELVHSRMDQTTPDCRAL